MKEQLISFETAKLAKEKGLWQEIGFSKFNRKGELFSVFEKCEDERKNTCIAPPQSLLQKWLRERHKIHINIFFDLYTFSISLLHPEYPEGKKYYKDLNLGSLEDKDTSKLLNYEQALEQGLQEALKLIK